MANEQFTNPVYEQFHWAPDAIRSDAVQIPGRVFANFADATRDITSGMEVVLGMIERDLIEQSGGSERQILNPNDSANLLRMACRSMEVLKTESERMMDWAYRCRTPEGLREREAVEAIRHALND